MRWSACLLLFLRLIGQKSSSSVCFTPWRNSAELPCSRSQCSGPPTDFSPWRIFDTGNKDGGLRFPFLHNFRTGSHISPGFTTDSVCSYMWISSYYWFTVENLIILLVPHFLTCLPDRGQQSLWKTRDYRPNSEKLSLWAGKESCLIQRWKRTAARREDNRNKRGRACTAGHAHSPCGAGLPGARSLPEPTPFHA